MRTDENEVFPIEFSSVEKFQTLALLEEAERKVRPYSGAFTAPWLLSPIHSNIWHMIKGAETRNIDGKMIDYCTYNWSARLNDGSNLIDNENKMLLQGMQRLAFLVRELPGGPNNSLSLRSFLHGLNFLVRWIFLNDKNLNPRKSFFSKMTHQHFSDLFIDMAKGGAVFALRYPERFLQAVFPLALGRPPYNNELEDPLNLSAEACHAVSQWLKSNNYMRKKIRSANSEMTLIPKYIGHLINVDTDTIIGNQKWQIFLRQFDTKNTEPEQPEIFLVYSSSSSKRELPTKRTLTNDEAKTNLMSENSLKKYLCDLRYIISVHRHLPGFCPNPTEFKIKELNTLIQNMTTEPKHTPWVPLPIAMSYTTEALRWLHVYGEDLVTTFLRAYHDLYNDGLLVSSPVPQKPNPTNADFVALYKKFTEKRESYVDNLDLPISLTPLNIKGLAAYNNYQGQKAFLKLRNSPSLMDAIKVLIGAITIVITMTKPMRESEFRKLKRTCISHVKDDGYWLSHNISKNNIEDLLPSDARPIPFIAAKAVQLLCRLTDGIKETIGITDPWLLDSLVTLPSFGNYEADVSVPTTMELSQILDAFCDYVALPPDALGRRWYIRIHEMRKSFLITFFWTFRYSSIDAARWIAGHSDAKHIYEYIQANFPGEELPSLEAEYASKMLREYKESGVIDGVINIDTLYKAVCDHFLVRDVSWIGDQILRDWLEIKFESHEFEILPHSIKNPDGGTYTEIAFRVSTIKT